MNPLRRLLIALVPAALMLGVSCGYAQQPYPAKPIRFFVPFPPGGPTDVLARSLAAAFFERNAQPLVVENRAGANTNISTDACAKSPADGYTICMIATPVSLNPYLYAKMPFDPEKDLDPVTNLVFAPEVLVVSATIPVNSVRELVNYSRSNPGKLNYASFGLGGTPHLVMEWLKKQTGADLTHVPFKGAAMAVPALVTGEVHAIYLAVGSPGVLAQVKSGKIRAVLVSGSRRNPLLPDAPTFAEAGLPELASRVWFGLAAPAGTPRPVVNKLSAEVAAIIQLPGFRERLATLGFEPVGNTAEEFARFLAEDRVRGANLVKISGARLD